MSHGFYGAAVEVEGGLDELLTVARRARADDVDLAMALRGFLFKLMESVESSLDGMALALYIIGEKESAVGSGGHHLRRRGPGVDAYGHLFVTAHGFHGHSVAILLGPPCFPVVSIAEQRLETLFEHHLQRCLRPTGYLRETDEVSSVAQGTAHGGNEVALRGDDEAVGGPLQVVGKSFTECRQIGERSTTEQHRRLQRTAMSECRDGLHGNGMEDRSCYISLRDIAADEILDIGLGKDSATRSHGIDTGRRQGFVAQFLIADSKQCRHLVDEGSRASGTVTVHAQLGVAPLEEHYLGVLTAYIDECLRLGMQPSHIGHGRYNLLYKGRLQLLRRSHAHASRNMHPDLSVPQPAGKVGEIVAQELIHVGVMAFIPFPHEMSFKVQHHHLGGSRPHVYTYIISLHQGQK